MRKDLDNSIKEMLIQRPEALKVILRKNKNIEDLLRPREKWEQNEHCLKSIGFRLKPKKPIPKKTYHV
jgi:hypothetical protein